MNIEVKILSLKKQVIFSLLFFIFSGFASMWAQDSSASEKLFSVHNPDEAERLIRNGAKVNSRNKSGETPLYSAALWGKLEVAKVLVKHGALIDARDNRKCTPLHVVAFTEGRSDFGIAELLINHGANVNARDISGLTPLHGAAIYGRTPLAQLLIKNGAKVTAKDNKGLTPLHYTSEYITSIDDNVNMVKLLINSGASVNSADKSGYTPLHKLAQSRIAAGNGKIAIDVARVLLRNGADINARVTSGKDKGKTPLKLAKENKFVLMVKFFRKRGGKY